jgi:hypothetical protein
MSISQAEKGYVCLNLKLKKEEYQEGTIGNNMEH